MQSSQSTSFQWSDSALNAAQLSATLQGMIDALGSERRLIEELTTIMRRQRAAVASDDLQGVDDSVYAVQRVLFTLSEARKRRRAISQRLGRGDDMPLRDLERLFGAAVTPALCDARDRLHEAVRTLSTEVTVNRRVLREALAAGDDYVRALCGAPEAKPLYGEGAAEAPANSYILDRQA
jgi:hypothetical protein